MTVVFPCPQVGPGARADGRPARVGPRPRQGAPSAAARTTRRDGREKIAKQMEQ